MEAAVVLALAHGWSDDAVAKLERLLTNKNMAAALSLVRAQDMPKPVRQELMEMVVLAVVS